MAARKRKKITNAKTKYRSKFEEEVVKLVPPDFKYEVKKVKYVEPESIHTYLPDLYSSKRKLIIEIKGRFRDGKEVKKYINIRNSLKHTELVFLFMNPNTPMPFAKRRKDGTKRTMKEWAEDNSFKFYTKKTINNVMKDFAEVSNV